MNQIVCLRSALPDDLDALVALERRCFAGDRLSRRSFRRRLRPVHAGLILAEANHGALVGYVLVLLRRGTRVARLYSIAIDPAWRGHGLGDTLLTAAEDYARRQRRLYLRLEVRRDNRAAIRLYERRGYALFACVPAYYEDREEALRYQKTLSRRA